MYETSYNGISYCFFDDHLTLNGNAISYELMDNIQHRGGDAPAFIFDYSGQKFAMPYPPEELPKILPYMKAASNFRPAPVDLVSLGDLPVEQPVAVAEPIEPTPNSSAFHAPPASPAGASRKSAKKGCLVLIVVLALLFVALGACMAGGDDSSDDSSVPDEPVVSEETAEAPTTAPDPLADLNAEERNAYGSAVSYLSTQGFSRSGLIDQLKYEQYSEESCEKAVSLIEENGEVDWNEECLESAKNYLASMSFSKQELIDQLKYEGFTDEQINAVIDEAYQ